MQELTRKPSPVEFRILKAFESYPKLQLRMNNKGVEFVGVENFKVEYGSELRPEKEHIKSMVDEKWIKLDERDGDIYLFSATEKGIFATQHGMDLPEFAPTEMDAHYVKGRLRNWHSRKFGWLFYTEIGLEERIVDALAISRWGTNRVVSYEVKVDRKDLLSEFGQPEKRQPALKYTNQFYFVVPQGLADEGEIPPEAGFKIVKSNGFVQTLRDAPWTEAVLPDWGTISRLIDRYHLDRLKLLGKEELDTID